ncbi:Cannabidiolic acid synthase [Platanthera guangdongensis]|uniref:Cannabidiolic acid synthase n=1 Tax=Platanthera guangdongensis TaxID=2320717 RepID=A0ABR2MZB3_9ASPA
MGVCIITGCTPLPENPNYKPLFFSSVHNDRTLSSSPKPLLIIIPTQEFHVSATVLCSKELKIQLITRSGKHDFEGLSRIPPRALPPFSLNSMNSGLSPSTQVIEHRGFSGLRKDSWLDRITEANYTVHYVLLARLEARVRWYCGFGHGAVASQVGLPSHRDRMVARSVSEVRGWVCMLS